MIKMSCPYCETVKDVKKVAKKESRNFKGCLVKYDAIHYECCSCHNFFDSSEMMDMNLGAIREAYEQLYQAITPGKIRCMREKYNASQKAFGIILGMGELTINSYEQEKSVPTSSNRLLLKLAENPLVFFEMYERNKSKIGIIQREHIESSEAYINCHKWGGLSSLYNRLSESDRKTIENKTLIYDDSVTQIVTSMVKAEINKPSFDIYKDAHEIEEGACSGSTIMSEQFSTGVA